MVGLILGGLIDHNIAACHEPDRDEHAGDGKEFNVAVHLNSDRMEDPFSPKAL